MMNWLPEVLKTEWLLSLGKAIAVLVIGLFVAKVLTRVLSKLLQKALDQQRLMILQKTTFYLLVIIVFMSSLSYLGFDWKVLLGAAGIFTVAIGFASQTSASNLISGLFLIAERPFVVGDVIRVGETTGVVLSIDLLSTRLRTFDNLLVRIPNETLMKSQLTNITHFPIRRVDLKLGIAYKENTEKVREILFNLADRHPLCLDEPKPVFILLGFGDSSIDIQFSFWTKKENFLEIKNTFQGNMKKAFDEHGIEIPFPHRTLYAGSTTPPIPVSIMNVEENKERKKKLQN